MMKNKLSFVLVIVWLSIGILTLFMGIKSVLAGENRQYITLFIMSAVSFMFAWVRNSQRKKNS